MPDVQGVNVPQKAVQDYETLGERVTIPGYNGTIGIAFRAEDPQGNPQKMSLVEAIMAIAQLAKGHGYVLELLKKFLGLVGKKRPDKPDNETSLLLMWKELSTPARKVVLHYVLDEPIGLTEDPMSISQEEMYLAMIIADGMIALDMAPNVQATLELG